MGERCRRQYSLRLRLSWQNWSIPHHYYASYLPPATLRLCYRHLGFLGRNDSMPRDYHGREKLFQPYYHLFLFLFLPSSKYELRQQLRKENYLPLSDFFLCINSHTLNNLQAVHHYQEVLHQCIIYECWSMRRKYQQHDAILYRRKMQQHLNCRHQS